MDYCPSAPVPISTIAKILAYFEIVISLFNFIAITFNAVLIFGNRTAFSNFVRRDPEHNKDFVKFLDLDEPIQVTTLLLLLLLCVVGLGLGILLLSGTNKRNLLQLKAWRVTTAIVYMLCLPIYVVWLIYSNDILTLVCSFLVIYFLGGFSFYVVYILIYQIEIDEAERLLDQRESRRDIPGNREANRDRGRPLSSTFP